MFAVFTHFYRSSENPYLQEFWTQVRWVENPRQATKLSKLEADRRLEELKQHEATGSYNIERDESGEANLPPYGLDNWVVRKA